MRRLSLLALAAALIAVPAFAVPTSPSDHGLFDSGAAPPQASGIVTFVDLGNALDAYVTQTSLTDTLAGYLPLTALSKPMTLEATLDVKGAVTLESDAHVEGDAKVEGDVHLGGVFTQSSATSSSGKWTGQGAGLTWNQVNGGRGATELVNVNPGVRGGFDFFDVGSGSTLTSSSSPLLSMSNSSGYQFYNLAGTGNAYVCVSSTGIFYRSSTACN